MPDTPLPEFQSPPVSEVALAVHFSPLAGWNASHGGLFWGTVRGEYPLTEVHPPVQSQLEQFGDGFWVSPKLTLELGNIGEARFWFLNPAKTKLIQVQRDRFIVNWRRVRGDEPYPRYQGEMRERFTREWESFVSFVSDNKLGAIDVLQCEITYLNDLLQGNEWSTVEEGLTHLFSPWWQRGSTGFLPAPHTMALAAAFLMPESKGRLHVQVSHLKRAPDDRETLRLQLIARGRPSSSDTRDVLSWMDMGRDWVVRGFTDVTSAEAHVKWGRRQ